MVITNPTNATLTVEIKGIFYTLAGGDSLDLPSEVAIHWQEQIHNFLVLSEDKTEEKTPVEEPIASAPSLQSVEVVVEAPVAEVATPKVKAEAKTEVKK